MGCLTAEQLASPLKSKAIHSSLGSAISFAREFSLRLLSETLPRLNGTDPYWCRKANPSRNKAATVAKPIVAAGIPDSHLTDQFTRLKTMTS